LAAVVAVGKGLAVLSESVLLAVEHTTLERNRQYRKQELLVVPVLAVEVEVPIAPAQ
jgi:hypothetical protein